MHRFHLHLLVVLLIGSTMIVGAQAQQQRNRKDPHIGYVYPAGGKQGTMFEVTVGGQFLEGVSGVRVAGEGVRATIEKYTRPLTTKEFNELRDKLMEARMKSGEQMMNLDMLIKRDMLAEIGKEIGIDDETIKALIDYRKKLLDPKRQLNPQLAESVRLKIYIAPNAPLGMRELRLITPIGLSNPIRFFVGDLPEFAKLESDGKVVPVLDALPVTINGQLLPGHVDRYSFTGHKGERVLVRAYVRRLIPYLADAVPGWFQAELTLYDAKGRELAYAEDFRFDPDPVLFYEFPAEGQYTLEIRDALYRGREDFVYRVTVGDLPFVTGIFPLGAREGEKTTVQATGWNLPAAGVTVEKWESSAGMQSLSVMQGAWQSNSVPFLVDTLQECLEVEPNNDIASAQNIKTPMIVNGRINAPGDWDVFCFEGRSGDQIAVEVLARRLNSPMDSVLELTNAAGKRLAVNDDHEDKGEGLSTHHADSFLNYTLPSSGLYYLRIGDAQGKGGPEYAYRLRVSLPQPDFALRVVPSCINIRSGSVVPITVYALRKDGFDGEIALSLKNSPMGAALDGERIPVGQDKVRLTLTVPATCTLGSYVLAIEGRAAIKSEEVRRLAVPADDMMQAFMYRHLVPSNEQIVTVVESGKLSIPLKISQGIPVKLRRGEANHVRLSYLVGPNIADQLKVELNEPPDGITLEDTIKSRSGLTLVVKVDPAKVKEELRGNLLVDAILERTPPPVEGKPPGNKQRIPIGTLPAIPFEVSK